ncbi:MAG: hypothetical protein U0821_00605 [Chloroflexota bacterium]
MDTNRDWTLVARLALSSVALLALTSLLRAEAEPVHASPAVDGSLATGPQRAAATPKPTASTSDGGRTLADYNIQKE